jgi:O-antigen ligase
VVVPIVALPIVAGLALGGLVVPAAAVAVVALVLPRVSVGALDVRFLVWVLAGVAFLVPDRFAIAASLPIDLEPYRILFGFITLIWLVVLLTNPEARFRHTIVDLPLTLIFTSILVSVIANPERANRFEQSVVKALLLFATYILMVYLISSAFPTLADTRRLIEIIVGLGTVVAGCAVVESATGYNVFNEWLRLGWLSQIPLADIGNVGREGETRAVASASHPIALGVVLIMLFPLAGYLAHHDRRWLLSVVLLPAGTFATVSRTAIVMLVVIMIVLAWLRPVESLRLAAVVGVAGLGLLVASPSSLTAVGASFFPKGGIVAQQSNTATGNVESRGRLADLRPVLHDWAQEPIVGQGFGSRPVDGRQNSLGDGRYSGVLDDEWLDLLLEIGAVGVFAWALLFFVLLRALSRRARTHDDAGLLCVALLSSVIAFVVAMLFIDAFGFPQLTFVAFLVIAISANVIRQTGVVAETRPARPGTEALAFVGLER